MGQKIIPTNFRLNHFKNWESSWVVPKSQYADVFYFEHNIRKFLQTLTNRNFLNCNKIKIKKQANSFQIYLYLDNQKRKKPFHDLINLQKKKHIIEKNLQKYAEHFKLNYTVKFYIINLNFKILKKGYFFYRVIQYLKKKKINHKTKNFFGIVNMSIYTQNVYLLNQFLIKNLTKTPRHLQFLKTINILLYQLYQKYPNFKGYKIQWKGRLNGRERARKMVYTAGSIPLNTINNNIKYNYQKVITPAGVCGLKTWFLFDSK